jgi:hypothetical protein
MPTALSIITDALVKIGVYAPSETPTDSDVAQGLISLNDMIDQWANEYLYVTAGTMATLTLAINKASYTIGLTAGADLALVRPVQITYGPGQAALTISGTTTPVNCISSVEWNHIYSITPGTGTPNVLFYDPQYPLGVLNVAPTPNAIGALVFEAWTPFTVFPNYGTAYAFTPGMDDAMKSNLALVLKPYFATSPIDPLLVAEAMRDKAMLRYTNLASRAMIGRQAAAPGAARQGAPQ